VSGVPDSGQPMSVSSRTDHVQVARVIGIPIYLHSSWLIIFGLIVWTLSTGYFPAQYPDLPASSYWAKGLVASLLALFNLIPAFAMVEGVVTVPSSGSVAEAAREFFTRTGYGSYPVTRGEAVVGLLCLKDVLQLSAEEREATSVQGAMRPLTDAIVTEPDAPLPVAIARMAQSGTARLLVMNGDRLVGLLTMNGVIRRLKVREELAG
jgi:CBS domain-containing protein